MKALSATLPFALPDAPAAGQKGMRLTEGMSGPIVAGWGWSPPKPPSRLMTPTEIAGEAAGMPGGRTDLVVGARVKMPTLIRQLVGRSIGFCESCGERDRVPA